MLPPDMMQDPTMAPPGPPGMGGGGLPPDLGALLGGSAPPAEAPPAEPAGITEGTPGGGEEALTEALDLLQVAIDAEADQEDVQVMLACQTKLQGILAKNQADADAAMGGKVNPKAMRKQAGGLGY